METIRIARPEDCAAIARVHVESWRTTYKEFVPVKHHPSYDQRLNLWQQVLATSSNESITLIAVNEQGQLVGFVNSGNSTNHDTLEYEVELTAIYLLEEAQRHGLGRRLLQAFVEQLLQVGHHSMLLWVFAQNRTACHFYESLGGMRIRTAQFPIGGASYEVIAYGWPDISTLL